MLQTIMNMEKSGGLSPVLKQRIADTKVAIVGSVAVELIADAIRGLGFVDIVSVPDSADLLKCDVVMNRLIFLDAGQSGIDKDASAVFAHDDLFPHLDLGLLDRKSVV